MRGAVYRQHAVLTIDSKLRLLRERVAPANPKQDEQKAQTRFIAMFRFRRSSNDAVATRGSCDVPEERHHAVLNNYDGVISRQLSCRQHYQIYLRVESEQVYTIRNMGVHFC